MSLFTVGEREALRDELVALARSDADIAGAALVGSAARGAEDRWSDIDLVLQLAPGAEEPEVVERWTGVMLTHGLADHLDVRSREGVRYRVFLMATSLQVDVSFWPHEQFGATAPGFQLLFGEAAAQKVEPPADLHALAGWAWLHALHARASIRRDRPLQAVMMLDGLRDQVVALACARRGLDAHHGRDADALPGELVASLARARSSTPERESLTTSLTALTDLLVDEVRGFDADRAALLAPAMSLLD